MANGEQATGQVPVVQKTPRERLWKRFERRAPESTFFLMCDRAAKRRASVGGPCEACDGIGSRMLSPGEMAYWKERIEKETRFEERKRQQEAMLKASKCGACDGTGYTSQRPDDDAVRMDGSTTTVGCPTCRGFDARNELKNDDGTARYPKLMDRHHGSSCGEVRRPTDASAETGDLCPRCFGAAYIVPITARPTMKTRDERLATDDDDPDHAFAFWQFRHPEAEAKAAPEEAITEEHALALEALYGEHGDRWAQHQWGRRFALWALTRAGRDLAAESLAESAELDPFARLLDLIRRERQAEIESTKGNPRRRTLLAKADQQARALEREAVRALREIEAA